MQLNYSPANMIIVTGIRDAHLDEALFHGHHCLEVGEVLLDVNNTLERDDTPGWLLDIAKKCLDEYSADYIKLTK